MADMRGFCIGLVACLIAPGALAQAPAPSFSKQIAPVLKVRCAACHMTGTEPGKIILAGKGAYAALVGAPSTEAKMLRVSPGKPQESYLLRKLKGTHCEVGGTGARMPLAGAPLDAATMAAVEAWIAAGAKND